MLRSIPENVVAPQLNTASPGCLLARRITCTLGCACEDLPLGGTFLSPDPCNPWLPSCLAIHTILMLYMPSQEAQAPALLHLAAIFPARHPGTEGICTLISCLVGRRVAHALAAIAENFPLRVYQSGYIMVYH